jgi:hypothetical protein
VVETRSKGGDQMPASARWAYVAWVAVLVVLFGAACYETVVALGWVALGSQAGEGPAGERGVLAAGLSALVVGAVLSWWAAAKPRVRVARLAPLIAPLGAAFMTARFYTFDPYYLPTLRRMSEGGIIFTQWVFVLVGLAVVAALLTRLRPALGLRLAGVVLLGCAATALFASTGH